MILYALMAAMLFCVIPKPSKPQAIKTAKTRKRPSRECIIQHGANYWDGQRFAPSKSRAKVFPNDRVAWNYADTRFSEDVADACHLISAKKAE